VKSSKTGPRESGESSPFDWIQPDGISQGPDGAAVLSLVRVTPWSATPAELAALRETLAGYVAYVRDGSLARQHPQLASEAWRIVIDSHPDRPDDEVMQALRAAGDEIADLGGELILRQFRSAGPTSGERRTSSVVRLRTVDNTYRPVVKVGEPEDEANGRNGILGGVFLASPLALEAWDLARPTPPEWPAVEFKRIDSVMLGTLEAILTGVPYAAIDPLQLHRVVKRSDDDESVVTLVRPELVDALATMDEGQSHLTVNRWTATDELRAGPESIEEVRHFLLEMRQLAIHGHEGGTSMYLLEGL